MRLLHAGIDTSVMALWLGHVNLDTTQIYLHAYLELKEKALARCRGVVVELGILRLGGLPGDPTDAIVRVVLACVCGSDLWYYRGESPHAVGSIGQEFIGVVEQGRRASPCHRAAGRRAEPVRDHVGSPGQRQPLRPLRVRARQSVVPAGQRCRERQGAGRRC
jgi:hypothetical protein